LPNRFPDQGSTPEFNSVDASLWYIIAVGEYLDASRLAKQSPPKNEIERLQNAVEAILDGYAAGTRFGIRLDEDGLIAAGEPGVQLTWMDAKVGDWVVTPRIGKPVEIQALWLNALPIAGKFSKRWTKQLELGKVSFGEKFWNEEGGCLFDVVDNNHEPGSLDDSFRPNQIFAVGGLPLVLLDSEKARKVVDAVEQRLLTPVGLRSLSPDHPDYKPRYEGGVLERDGAYHQGTVWPWLIGPFVEAWLRVRKNSPEAKKEASLKFLEPLEMHIEQAGIGHISEICDAEAPHTPRGCPFQAWSYGEYMRIKHSMLIDV
jgi:predicted glycogen debranching enzyme